MNYVMVVGKVESGKVKKSGFVVDMKAQAPLLNIGFPQTPAVFTEDAALKAMQTFMNHATIAIPLESSQVECPANTLVPVHMFAAAVLGNMKREGSDLPWMRIVRSGFITGFDEDGGPKIGSITEAMSTYNTRLDKEWCKKHHCMVIPINFNLGVIEQVSVL